jgi:glutathione S-transferase
MRSAIAGPHDYDQILALVERQAARYSDLYDRLADVPFVAGNQFPIADDHRHSRFCNSGDQASGAREHGTSKRWQDSVSVAAPWRRSGRTVIMTSIVARPHCGRIAGASRHTTI